MQHYANGMPQSLIQSKVDLLKMTWLGLMRIKMFNETLFDFNSDFAVKTAAHCIKELDGPNGLEPGYVKKGEGRPYNVAGQMAVSIIKCRPIVINERGLKKLKNNNANETLAIIYGVLHCTHYNSHIKDIGPEKAQGFLGACLKSDWVFDITHKLVKRECGAQQLADVFETFCLRTFKN